MADGKYLENGNPICPYVFRPCKKATGLEGKPISRKSLAADISFTTDLCPNSNKNISR